MNFKSKPKKLDWKAIGLIVLVLAITGYQWYTKNYPAGEPVAAGADRSGTFTADDYQVNFPADDRSKSDSGKPDLKFKPLVPTNTDNDSGKTSGPFLKSIGGKNVKSPAGLIYGMGGGGEHRTDHVLRHAKDDTGRPVHGVFDAKGDAVFKLVDEAYELVKSKSKQVKSEKSRGNMAHIIDMKRKIGFKGGQSGKRNRNPALYKIKLILVDGNRVITAYPY